MYATCKLLEPASAARLQFKILKGKARPACDERAEGHTSHPIYMCVHLVPAIPVWDAAVRQPMSFPSS